MTKTFYSAYTCKGNIGDLLINKYQIEEYAKYGEVYVDCTGMPKAFKEVIFATDNKNIKDFAEQYHCNIRSINVFKVLKLLQREGFTHYTKSPGPYAHIKFPLRTFITRLIGSLSYIRAKALGMKVFALGIDMNYKNTSKSLQNINRKYFSHYDCIGVRSKHNQQILSDELSNVMYIPDMAFLCPDIVENKRCEKKKIALSFRDVEDRSSLISQLNAICHILIEQGFQIELVYQVKEDQDFCEFIKDSVDFPVSYREKMIGYNDLCCYSEYDYVLSNRLHVILMAAMHVSIPFALISRNRKERKIRDVLDSAFTTRLWSYIDEFRAEDLVSVINDSNISKRLQDEIVCQSELCRQTIKGLYRE